MLEGARKKEGGLISENKDRCHALIAVSLGSSYFIIDLGGSSHVDSMQYSLSIIHPYSGPSILMGDDSEIPTKGIGKINLGNGHLNNVLCVHHVASNLLSIYPLEHTFSTKRVTFTQGNVNIS